MMTGPNYLHIALFLLDQDFVPIKKSILSNVLEFKTKLRLSQKAVRNIEISREKINLLSTAIKAYNGKDYKVAMTSAEKGLSLRTEHYKPNNIMKISRRCFIYHIVS